MQTSLSLAFRAIVFSGLLLIALASAFWVYSSGLSGPFVFDDAPNVQFNRFIAIQGISLNSLTEAAGSSGSSRLGRPLSMVSFALNYYMTGLDPFYFKLTNLMIHLANGLGIFFLTLLLLNVSQRENQLRLDMVQLRTISLAVAAAWLLHPFNLTGVLYVVQRMTSLSAFFSIWGLVLFLWGRIRLSKGRGGVVPVLASFLVFTPLAVLSKESGALLPVFMLLTEVVFFSFRVADAPARKLLLGCYLLFMVIPIIGLLGYTAAYPHWLLAGYENRDFTLAERLMTEARVLWFYLWQIVLPSNAQMGLYHDDIVNSTGLLKPVSTLVSIVGILVLLGGAFVLRKKASLLSFGILFFFAGHVLESTLLPLDIAYEHRNYLPMVGILLPMFYYLLNPSIHPGFLGLRRTGAVLLIVLFAFGTYMRANDWSNPYDFALAEYQHHPDSVRANLELAHFYGTMKAATAQGQQSVHALAEEHYLRASRLSSHDVNGLIGLIKLTSENSRTVQNAWLTTLSDRLGKAKLASVTGDRLLDLTNCTLSAACKLSSDSIWLLLEAALDNKTLTGLGREKVLYAKSSYLINVEHDYSGAIESMRQMIAIDRDEPALRFPLIRLLMALERYDEAGVEIRKTDTLKLGLKDRKNLQELARQVLDAQAGLAKP